MKKLLAIVGVSCLATGCMSGTVGVQDLEPQNGSGSAGQASPKVEHENLNTAVAEAQTLYFAALSSAAGGAASFAGLGFLSMGAQVDTPFEYFFSEPGQSAGAVLDWRPVIFSGSEEVAWIQSSSAGTATLQVMDPESLEVQEQVNIPLAEAYALPVDLSAPEVAGVGSDRKLFVWNSEGGVKTGKSGFASGSQIFWIAGTERVGVLDPTAKTVSIFARGDRSGIQTPAISFPADSFSASPSGSTYLVFSGGTLSEIDAATGTSSTLAVAISAFVDPRWNGEQQVAFVDSPAGQSQVDVLSLESGQIESKYAVSETSPSLICPSWMSGSLFFANENAQGASVIWRGEADGSETLFATPQSSDVQYVCPKGVSR